jgi:hypothetical protein
MNANGATLGPVAAIGRDNNNGLLRRRRRQASMAATAAAITTAQRHDFATRALFVCAVERSLNSLINSHRRGIVTIDTKICVRCTVLGATSSRPNRIPCNSSGNSPNRRWKLESYIHFSLFAFLLTDCLASLSHGGVVLLCGRSVFVLRLWRTLYLLLFLYTVSLCWSV